MSKAETKEKEFTYKWEIKEKQLKNIDNEMCLITELLCFKDMTFCMRFYPNGFIKDKKGQVAIFIDILSFSKNIKNMIITHEMKCLETNTRKLTKDIEINCNNMKFGWKNFMTNKQLKSNYLITNQYTLIFLYSLTINKILKHEKSINLFNQLTIPQIKWNIDGSRSINDYKFNDLPKNASHVEILHASILYPLGNTNAQLQFVEVKFHQDGKQKYGIYLQAINCPNSFYNGDIKFKCVIFHKIKTNQTNNGSVITHLSPTLNGCILFGYPIDLLFIPNFITHLAMGEGAYSAIIIVLGMSILNDIKIKNKKVEIFSHNDIYLQKRGIQNDIDRQINFNFKVNINSTIAAVKKEWFRNIPKNLFGEFYFDDIEIFAEYYSSPPFIPLQNHFILSDISPQDISAVYLVDKHEKIIFIKELHLYFKYVGNSEYSTPSSSTVLVINVLFW